MAAKKQRPQKQRPLLIADEAEEARRVAKARGAVANLGLQARVTEPMARILLYLDRYGSNDDEQPGCRARLKTIANYIGQPIGKPIAIRTLQKYLRTLREAGLVVMSRRDGLPVNRVNWPRVREMAHGQAGSSPNGAQEPAARKEARPRAEKSGASSRQSGASSRQSGASSRQSGAPSKQLSKQLSKPLTSQGAPLRDGSWEEEEEKLLKLGMGMAQHALARVSSRQVSLGEVQALIAFWESMQPAWGIGALFRTLENLRPGMQPEGMPWPPKSDEWTQSQRRAATESNRASQADQYAAAAAEKAAEKERLAELEAEHGATLDALTDEEYREMVKTFFPQALLTVPRGLRESSIVRGVVLQQLGMNVR